jgi:mono/diheme cytochrome c family protein
VRAQAPTWSAGDLAFFLHGTMGAEFVPERVLRAFVATFPEPLPRADLANFGLIPDADFGWPIGLSRRSVAHLGGLPSLGVNCAACHVSEIETAAGAPVHVLGATSHFDAEAFFNAILGATFRTADPASLRRFVVAYAAAGDPAAGPLAERAWQAQAATLAAAVAADPLGAKDVAPGALHAIAPADVALDRAALERGADLVPTVRALLRLFHNMRAAVHVPDAIPAALPPPSGPGRNDAFGLLSLELLGTPRPYAPVKYGIVWNLEGRPWVHWDGNTRSPMGRNLLAALGLGAPVLGTRGVLDVAVVQRQTDLPEKLRAPRWPWALDAAAAARGARVYAARCASCHDAPEGDARLHAPDAVGTDPARARAFTTAQAEGFNRFLGRLEMPGYRAPAEPGLRATGRYWAPTLAGVWARSPYLHNGSVRTLAQLLTPPAARAPSFHRGTRRYDVARVGFLDAGPYVLDTRTPGNGNGGHAYGTDLPPADKHDLLEYLKTL